MTEKDSIASLDRLVREDVALGAEIARTERARDVRIQFFTRQGREESAPFERELARLREKRDAVRQAILDAWARDHAAETTLDLPSGRVSRRNYRDLVVHDRMALLYSLERIDRLDLVEFVFDGPAVARLVAEGALPDLPTGAVSIQDRYNLQVRQKDAPGANVGDLGRPLQHPLQGPPPAIEGRNRSRVRNSSRGTHSEIQIRENHSQAEGTGIR